MKSAMSVRHMTHVVLVGLLSTSVALSGCSAVAIHVVRDHPDQDRLERLVGKLLPHTDDPTRHYWVRVSRRTDDHVDLWVLRQRHIYVSDVLVQGADDTILTAILAHGIAHHERKHHGIRDDKQ